MLRLLPFLVVSATAANIPRATQEICGLSLTAVGASTNSAVNSFTISSNKLSKTSGTGVYTLASDGLTDVSSHACGISLTTNKFHCAADLMSSTKFTLAENGNLLHDGEENWVACATSTPGSYKIYGEHTGCEPITLRTSPACAPAPPPSSLKTSITSLKTPSSLSVSNTTLNATCPSNINSTPFLSPNLLVPTSPNASTQAFGPSTKAYISPLNTTLYNFAVPTKSPWSGTAATPLTCALVFLFPFASDLDASAGKFYFSGIEQEQGQHGGLDFALLSGAATNGSTFATTPAVTTDFGKVEIIPGNNYTIGTFECRSGQTYGVSGSSKGNTELDYFQDVRVQPIGLFVVPCS